jgi:hypothetical protein
MNNDLHESDDFCIKAMDAYDNYFSDMIIFQSTLSLFVT